MVMAGSPQDPLATLQAIDNRLDWIETRLGKKQMPPLVASEVEADESGGHCFHNRRSPSRFPAQARVWRA
jgi:hypothetical protein